jgi:hypothetical protein
MSQAKVELRVITAYMNYPADVRMSHPSRIMYIFIQYR